VPLRVPLSLACGAYDRTAALARGDIRPEGVDLTFLAFEQARREAAARLAETAAGASLLPWAYADAERTRDVMGADLKDLRPGRERGHAAHVRPVLVRAGPDQPAA
jgi:hypothetical protein